MSDTRFGAPDWRIRHLNHTDGPITDYFNPQGLSFTLNKGENGPHEITYEVSRSQGIVFPGFVSPYGTDFELSRGEDIIMNGMHTPFSIESNAESVQIAGKSYIHYLQRRQWDYDSSDPDAFRLGLGLSAAPNDIPPTGYSYAVTNVEVMLIVKDLLDMVLLDDNSLTFSYHLPAIGHAMEAFTVSLPDTEPILSKITSLSQEEPGEFDFWMDTERVFRVAAPHRYNPFVYNDIRLVEHVFDSTLPETGFSSVGFTNNGPLYTWLLGQGQNNSYSLASVKEYLAASEQFRRLDGTEDFPNVPGQTRVNRLTRKKLLFGLNPIHEITLTVVPDKINNFWTRFEPGKAIWLLADLEGWRIDSPQEIVTMTCEVDSSGNELVTFGLNQIYQSDGIDVD